MSEQEANVAYLEQHIQAPCLGRIPFSPHIHPKDLVHHLAASDMFKRNNS